MKKLIVLAYMALSVAGIASGACPVADVNGDCEVDLEDFAIMASEWLYIGEPLPVLNGMTWVSVNDSGAGMIDEYGDPISCGGFTGEMGKYETTNAQYCQFLNSANADGQIVFDSNRVYDIGHSQVYYYLVGLGNTAHGATDGGAARIYYNGSSFVVDSGFENHPVTYVSWYGSTAFCNYYGYRLPTEWEWQAVADFNGSYTYGCGTSINNSIANYQDSMHPDGTTVVDSYGTFGYGMSDMAGNVWECTSSVDGDSYRIIRGGAWSYNSSSCTVWGSFSCGPSGTYANMGFRVCR